MINKIVKRVSSLAERYPRRGEGDLTNKIAMSTMKFYSLSDIYCSRGKSPRWGVGGLTNKIAMSVSSLSER